MYEKFYGFTASPFQVSPDHRFFFESSVHRTALAHLTYGLSQGEGFIIITGEVGAGKTTLVGHLFETLDKKRFVAARVVSTQLQADDMLRMVAAAFGLPIAETNKASLLRLVEGFLVNNLQQGKRSLLVVDEAQNLSIPALEELRMLSNFQSGPQAPLQSFLLGQPQFRTLLASPDLDQLRQRVIASYHLGPLGSAETRAYVEHRLKRVGWTGNPAIADDAFAAIHQASGGVPRRINTLCSRVLLLGFLEELRTIELQHVEKVSAELRSELEFQPQAPAQRSVATTAAIEPPRPKPEIPALATTATLAPAAPVPLPPTANDSTAPAPAPSAEQAAAAKDAAAPVGEAEAPGDPDARDRVIREMAARIATLEQAVGQLRAGVARHDRLLRQALSAATSWLGSGKA